MIKYSMGLALVAGVTLAVPAQAQVRDAEYRGTLICTKLPFAQNPTRAAITVKITNNEGPYERALNLPAGTGMTGTETGTAKVDGGKVALTGGWKGDKASFEATYAGAFVRRSAKLTGTQTWTYEGKTYTSTCSGAIKRPLAAFIPKQKKQTP